MKKTNRNVQTAMVYCGPDIPFTAKQFDSYTNGLPERLTLIMEEIPAVGSLVLQNTVRKSLSAFLLPPFGVSFQKIRLHQIRFLHSLFRLQPMRAVPAR